MSATSKRDDSYTGTLASASDNVTDNRMKYASQVCFGLSCLELVTPPAAKEGL